jgi:hypothetical protein
MKVLWDEANFQVEDFIRYIVVWCSIIDSYSAPFPRENGRLNKKKETVTMQENFNIDPQMHAILRFQKCSLLVEMKV